MWDWSIINWASVAAASAISLLIAIGLATAVALIERHAAKRRSQATADLLRGMAKREHQIVDVFEQAAANSGKLYSNFQSENSNPPYEFQFLVFLIAIIQQNSQGVMQEVHRGIAELIDTMVEVVED